MTRFLLVFFITTFNFTTITQAESISGIVNPISITSHRIFEEVIEGGATERVTEVCFQLDTEYSSISGIIAEDFLSQFKNKMNNQNNKAFILDSQYNQPTLIYDLDEFELRLTINFIAQSFENKNIEYLSSVFSQDFNRQRKNGQVSYEVINTNNFHQPTQIKFCEVYFFNNVSTPDSLIRFLLEQPQVGLLRLSQEIDYRLELVRKSDSSVVSAYENQFSTSIRVPIAGLNTSLFEYLFLQENINHNMTLLINNELFQKHVEYQKQSQLADKWYQWMNTPVNQRDISQRIDYPIDCEFLPSAVKGSTDYSQISKDYAIDMQSYGCRMIEAAIFDDQIDCYNSDNRTLCELNLPEGYLIVGTDFEKTHHVYYFNDHDSQTDFRVNTDNPFFDIALPYSCRDSLLINNNLSTLIAINQTISDSDLRRESVVLINDLIRDYEYLYPAHCQYRPISTPLRKIQCSSFMSQHKHCQLITEKDAWHIVFAKKNQPLFFYMDESSNGAFECDETDNMSYCETIMNTHTNQICVNKSLFITQVDFDGLCNIGLYENAFLGEWIYRSNLIKTTQQTRSENICFTPNFNIGSQSQPSAAIKIKCEQ